MILSCRLFLYLAKLSWNSFYGILIAKANPLIEVLVGMVQKFFKTCKKTWLEEQQCWLEEFSLQSLSALNHEEQTTGVWFTHGSHSSDDNENKIPTGTANSELETRNNAHETQQVAAQRHDNAKKHDGRQTSAHNPT